MTGKLTRRAFVSMAAAAPLLRAQTAQERGRDIINKTIHALGGDAFRYLRTRTETGRIYQFHIGRVSGYSIAHIRTKYLPVDTASSDKASVRQLQRQTLGKKEEDIYIFRPEGAWEITYRGATKLPDEQNEQRREALLRDSFYILRERVDEPGMIFEMMGSEVTENVPTHIIDVIDNENRQVRMWIHSSTLLPVKQRWYRFDPLIGGKHEEVTYFTKYRDAGNKVMWPTDVQRERDGEKIAETYIESMKLDEPLADSLFELPPGVKMVTPK